MAFPNGYTYQKLITVDHTKVTGSADLTNFPILVSETDSRLKTVGNGGAVQSSNGYDIRFETTGGTKLDHEIEFWTGSVGQINAWIRIPTLSHTADTLLYMYYGNSSVSASEQNPTGVWDSNYISVWHFGNGTTLSTADSTTNGFNLTNSGGAAPTSSSLGGAASFSGSAALAGTYSSALTWSAIRKVSFWFKLGNNSQAIPRFLEIQDGSNNGWVVGWSDPTGTNPNTVWINSGTGGSTSNIASYTTTVGDVADTLSHHFTAITNGTTVSAMYLDGVSVTPVSCSTGLTYGATPAAITVGGRNSGARLLVGSLDEFRIESSSRTSGWAVTEYNNQSSPSTFVSIGAETIATGSVIVNLTGSSATTSDYTPRLQCNANITSTGVKSTTVVASSTVTIVNPSGGTYSNGYSFRKLITQDHTKISGSSDLTNYPFLINTTDSRLKTVGNGGAVQNSSGYDIRFETTGGVKLDHQIETWNGSTGAIISWIRIPTLSHTADNLLYMYYGNASISASEQNPTGVWDSNYGAEWHFDDSGSTLADSTSRGNNGTINNSPTSVTGIIGNALSFNGTNQSIDANGVTGLLQTGSVTFSSWINFSSSYSSGSPVMMVLRNADAPSSNDLNLSFGNIDTLITDGKLHFTLYGSEGWNDLASSKSSWAANTWYYVVGTYSTTTGPKVYINGILDNSSSTITTRITPYSTHFSIGYSVSTSEGVVSNNSYFAGAIDDSSVSNIDRSGEWILTNYNNQVSSSTFSSFGAEQTNITNASSSVFVTGNNVNTSIGTASIVANSVFNIALAYGLFSPLFSSLYTVDTDTIGLKSSVGNVSAAPQTNVNTLGDAGTTIIGVSKLVANDNSYLIGVKSTTFAAAPTITTGNSIAISVVGNSSISSIGSVTIIANANESISYVNINSSNGNVLVNGNDNSYLIGVKSTTFAAAPTIGISNATIIPLVGIQLQSSLSAPFVVANSNENLIGQPLNTVVNNSTVHGNSNDNVTGVNSIGLITAPIVTNNSTSIFVSGIKLQSSLSAPFIVAYSNEFLLSLLLNTVVNNSTVHGNSNDNVTGIQGISNIGLISVATQTFIANSVNVSGTGITTSVASGTITANSNEHSQASTAVTSIGVCSINDNSTVNLTISHAQSQVGSVGVSATASDNIIGVVSNTTVNSVAINASSVDLVSSVNTITSIGIAGIVANEQVNINSQSVITGLNHVTVDGTNNTYLTSLSLNSNIGNTVTTVGDDDIYLIGVTSDTIIENIAIDASSNVPAVANTSTTSISSIAVTIGEMISVLSNQTSTSVGFVVVNASDETTVIPVTVNASAGILTFSAPNVVNPSGAKVIASIGLVTNTDNSNYTVNGIASVAIAGIVGVMIDHPLYNFIIALTPYGTTSVISSIDTVIKNVTSVQSNSSRT